MASREDIGWLQVIILQFHGCTSVHLTTVHVTVGFEGKAWDGDIEVFSLIQHPEAFRCYAWREADRQERVVTVLELFPVTSPETAVRAHLTRNDVGASVAVHDLR